jgi:hypothetical protein
MSFGYSHRFTLPSSSSRTIDEAARFYQSRDYAKPSDAAVDCSSMNRDSLMPCI